MDDNILGQTWRAESLLHFTFPTIVMMIFMGLYTVVDTIFVAQFVNTDALSSINIVCPVINITVGLGTMLATGGNAMISRKMGAGEGREAKEDFTLLVLTGAVMGFLILLGGTVWIDQIVSALGASDLLFPYCKDYLTVLFWFIPANILQTLFSNLFVTAGKPGLGFGLSVLAGVANMILDYIFIVPCGLGIRGAALGTGFGYLIPTAAGLAYFTGRKGTLSFTRPALKWAVIAESCFNGSSEMAGQLAAAVTTFLFNGAMMNLLGENGVAAITIMIYSQFLLNTLYIGYSMGTAPIIGFLYGNRRDVQQKRVFSISMGFIGLASVLTFTVSRFGGSYIVRLFTDDSTEVYQIAANGFGIFSCSFLFSGLNNFTSAMFTALSNGKVSAVLSFLRTFGLLAGGIRLLPRIWGITGVWLAVPFAEGIMFVVSTACLFRYRKRYGY